MTYKKIRRLRYLLQRKVVGVICDNILYAKKTHACAAVCPKLEEGSPYNGAKSHFVLDNVVDRETLARFIKVTCDELFAPKPKKKKSRNNKQYKLKV